MTPAYRIDPFETSTRNLKDFRVKTKVDEAFHTAKNLYKGAFLNDASDCDTTKFSYHFNDLKNLNSET